jgi:hypothetical protein
MRASAVALFAAALLSTGAASAVEPKGKNTPAPGAAPSSPGSSGGAGGDLRPGDQGKARVGGETSKPWEVGALWETHRLIIQNDLGGDAPNKLFNFLYLYATWDVSENNRFAVRFGAYERFIADAGEAGIRSDDLVFAYTRRIPLPGDFQARAVVSATLPTSFYAQKASLYTAPRLSVGVGRRFGRFSFDARALGTGYVTKYREMEGGNPNAKYSFGASFEADYQVPSLDFLRFGASINSGWSWYYDVANGADPSKQIATTVDPTFPTQPMQQAYGGEIFARADLPPLAGSNSSVTVAFAQGDPTLGSTSVLHDGVGHLYAFWRHTSEVYVALGSRF